MASMARASAKVAWAKVPKAPSPSISVRVVFSEMKEICPVELTTIA